MELRYLFIRLILIFPSITSLHLLTKIKEKHHSQSSVFIYIYHLLSYIIPYHSSPPFYFSSFFPSSPSFFSRSALSKSIYLLFTYCTRYALHMIFSKKNHLIGTCRYNYLLVARRMEDGLIH